MSAIFYRVIPLPFRNTAVSASITADDYGINVTDTSAARTISIAAGVVAATGKQFEIVDSSGGAGLTPIILDTTGTEKINGANNSISCITHGYGRCRVVSDGTNWVATEF